MNKPFQIIGLLLAITLGVGLSSVTLAQGYAVGDQVTDFSLKNIDGAQVKLSDVVKEGAIVIFTCNSCPYSVAYENRIIALDKEFASQGYPVVAINSNDVSKKPDDSYGNMIVRAKDKKFTFPYLHDESQQIAKSFGATKTPHVYVIKKGDTGMSVEYIGAIDNSPWDASEVEDEYVSDAVSALIDGSEIESPEVKAVGCTIKWKES